MLRPYVRAYAFAVVHRARTGMLVAAVLYAHFVKQLQHRPFAFVYRHRSHLPVIYLHINIYYSIARFGRKGLNNRNIANAYNKALIFIHKRKAPLNRRLNGGIRR